MNGSRHRLTDALIWGTILFFRWCVRKLPQKAAVRTGAAVGWIVWALSRKRVDRAERRCVRALGVGVTRARGIVRASYMNLGRNLAEFVRFPVTGKDVGKFMEIHGEENLRDAFEEGNGVIFLTAHLGNWEMGAALLAQMGYPMNAIGAEQRDPRITELIEVLRRSFNVKTISKGRDLKAALRCLKQGEVLGVLLDQDFGSNGLVVPFLGLEASTPYGPLKMADKLNSRIVPVFCIRRPDGVKHDMYLLPPLERPPEGGFSSDLEGSLRMCNDIISEWILKHPDQWMWLYPRWASTVGD